LNLLKKKGGERGKEKIFPNPQHGEHGGTSFQYRKLKGESQFFKTGRLGTFSGENSNKTGGEDSRHTSKIIPQKWQQPWIKQARIEDSPKTGQLRQRGIRDGVLGRTPAEKRSRVTKHEV